MEPLSSGKHLLIDLKPLESGLSFLQPSESTIPTFVFIHSYADGVLLGSVRLGNDVRHVLCNPAIDRYLVLPESVYGHRFCSSGLGFVPSKNDIGVVKIINNLDVENGPQCMVKVCYARERVWKTIAPDLASTYLPSRLTNNNCCINGRVHWVVRAKPLSEHLLVFDLERERFETLDLPAELVKDLRWQNSKITLLLFKQNLSVLFHSSKNYSLWSLMAYPDVSSWAKLWSFDSDTVTERLFTVFVGRRADYKLIVSRGRGGIMGVYDPSVGSSRESYVFPFVDLLSLQVWGFDESLFLWDEEMQALPLTRLSYLL